MPRPLLLPILALTLLLVGCDLVDSKLESSTKAYFPAAEIVKPRRDVVHVETHVCNISRGFAAQVTKSMLQEHGRDLSMGFKISGYQWLILRIDSFNVVWDIANPGWFQVLDARQFSSWIRFAFGRLDYPPHFVGQKTRRPLPRQS
ncbi:hypothetical protein [Paludibaculum fermentans]|uniref:hypothetical protein n=1 Tax=Paludibaculum fermentans TaxID=1473598 RepID=UPI003EC0131B